MKKIQDKLHLGVRSQWAHAQIKNGLLRRYCRRHASALDFRKIYLISFLAMLEKMTMFAVFTCLQHIYDSEIKKENIPASNWRHNVLPHEV